MTDAVMILERAANYARQHHVNPLLILAWQSNSKPETVKVPLPPGHIEALAAIHQVAGCNLWLWWQRKPDQNALVTLFEDAIFTLQMGAI